MKRALLAMTVMLAAISAAADSVVLRREFLSPVYTIDKKYRSMEGPGSTQDVHLGDAGKPELLWIVGISTEMVGEDGRTPQLAELMCHVNVDYDVETHRALFNLRRTIGSRVLTLSQGFLSARLPEGFGFPVASNEPLVLFTQVLNHNIEKPGNLRVRHRVRIEYIRERDMPGTVRPLLNVGASGTVLVPRESPSFSKSEGGAEHAPGAAEHGQGSSCLIAARAPNGVGMAGDYTDPEGRRLTGHWVVPPGKQTNTSDVTWFMVLPFDARLHYAAVHLHPFAESLTLRDASAKKDLFTSRAINPKDKVGLDHVDAFVSHEGVPLFRNHKYDLISVYNNPTTRTHDSMASVFLGVADPQFERPTSEELAQRYASMRR